MADRPPGTRHAFSTIRHARDLRVRHPDAPSWAAQVMMAMATYADGATGSNIWPGDERLADDTGLSESTVRRARNWLLARDELRRTSEGRRGHAASYIIPLPAQAEHETAMPAQAEPTPAQADTPPTIPASSAAPAAAPPPPRSCEFCRTTGGESCRTREASRSCANVLTGVIR